MEGEQSDDVAMVETPSRCASPAGSHRSVGSSRSVAKRGAKRPAGRSGSSVSVAFAACGDEGGEGSVRSRRGSDASACSEAPAGQSTEETDLGIGPANRELMEGLLAQLRMVDPTIGRPGPGKPVKPGEFKDLAVWKMALASAEKQAAEAVVANKVAAILPLPLKLAGASKGKGKGRENIFRKGVDELEGVDGLPADQLAGHVGRALEVLEIVRTKSGNLHGLWQGAMKIADNNLRLVAEELGRRVSGTGDVRFHEERGIRLQREVDALRTEAQNLRRRVALLESVAATAAPSSGWDPGSRADSPAPGTSRASSRGRDRDWSSSRDPSPAYGGDDPPPDSPPPKRQMSSRAGRGRGENPSGG